MDTTELDLAIERMNVTVRVGIQAIISAVITMTDDSITESIQSLSLESSPPVQEHIEISRRELVTLIEKAHNIQGLTSLTLTGTKIGIGVYDKK